MFDLIFFENVCLTKKWLEIYFWKNLLNCSGILRYFRFDKKSTINRKIITCSNNNIQSLIVLYLTRILPRGLKIDPCNQELYQNIAKKSEIFRQNPPPAVNATITHMKLPKNCHGQKIDLSVAATVIISILSLQRTDVCRCHLEKLH